MADGNTAGSEVDLGEVDRDEQLFVQRVTERRYTRLEVPGRASLGHAASGALWALGATLLSQRGFGDLAVGTASVGAAGFAAAAVWAARGELLRARGADGGPDGGERPDTSRGCALEGGVLRPTLAPDETLLAEADIEGFDARLLRKGGAAAQALVGFMLAGLPLAALAGAERVGWALGTWAALFSLLGALLFGRGVHLLLGARAARRLALTNQRLVAMAAPGMARSLGIDALRHRPVVVDRKLGGATVAFSLQRLPSTGVLPVLGLWGLDGVDPEDARRWASLVSAQRRATPWPGAGETGGTRDAALRAGARPQSGRAATAKEARRRRKRSAPPGAAPLG